MVLVKKSHWILSAIQSKTRSTAHTVTQTPFHHDSGHELWLSPVPQVPGTRQGTEGGMRPTELPLQLILLPTATQKKSPRK